MDWDKIDAEAPQSNQNFKSYAPNGEHQVKLEKVEVVDNPNWKSPAIVFHWADDEQYRYSHSVRHWLSLGNQTWRARHNRDILMALGFEKAKAQELITAAEKDTDRVRLTKAYEALYKRVAERKPTTTIIVQDQYRDGKPVLSDKGYTYSESDFAAFGARTMQLNAQNANDHLAGSEPIDMDEIPFD